MFESIKAKLTTRNVLIGLTTVAAIGGVAYYFLSGKEVADTVSDLAAGATEATPDLVETAVEVTEQAVKVVAETAETMA